MMPSTTREREESPTLFRSSSRDSFELALFSKRLEMQAETAIAESLNLEKQEAPQKKIDLQKNETDKLEVARRKNRKAFRP